MTSPNLPLFTVDVLDTLENRDGPGPIYSVLSVSVTTELDRTPEATIAVPANDQRAVDLLSSTKKLQIRTRSGYSQKFIVSELNLSSQGNMPVYQASCLGMMDELRQHPTFPSTVYDDADLKTEIIGQNATECTLLRHTGWNRGDVEDYGNTTLSLENQSVLTALLALAEQTGRHIRQGDTERTLDFGLFGDDSQVRITNVHHVLSDQWANPRLLSGIPLTPGEVLIAYISEAAVADIGSDIENGIVPIGKDNFTLEDAPSSCDIRVAHNFRTPKGFATTTDDATSGADIPCTDTTGFIVGENIWIGTCADWSQDHEVGEIQSISAGVSITLTSSLANTYAAGVDVIQQPIYYIQDSASIASHGYKTRVWPAAWIGPVDPSDAADREEAAYVLYMAAQARLERYKDPYQRYIFPVVLGFPTDVRVGDTVNVVYKGVVAPYSTSYPAGLVTIRGVNLYVEIEGDYYLTRATHTWEASGRQYSEIEVANIDRPTPANEDIILYNLDTLRWIFPG